MAPVPPTGACFSGLPGGVARPIEAVFTPNPIARLVISAPGAAVSADLLKKHLNNPEKTDEAAYYAMTAFVVQT